jgi:PIN domain nuclease of toxin-antitoxin system
MMLLDTHALIWYLTADPQLPDEIRDQISRQPMVYVSAVVIWEIAIKGSLGKLEFGGKPIDSREAVEQIITECVSQEFEFLNVSASHAAQAPFFASDHKDPFDRLLAAQAVQQGLFLVSRDAAFDTLSPGIQRLWAEKPAQAKRGPHKAGKKG